MKRYLRMYIYIIRAYTAMYLSYRVNFLQSVLSSGVWGTLILVSVFLFTRKITHIASWGREELMLLAAQYNFLMGLFYVCIAVNFKDLARLINTGKLDLFLLKPVDSQFFATFHSINPGNLFRVMIGLVLSVWLTRALHTQFEAIDLVLYLACFVISIVFLYSFWMLMMTTVIWFQRLDNLHDFLFTITGLGRHPKEVLLAAPKILFIWLPFFLTISIPVKALLGRMEYPELILFLLLSCMLCIVSRTFWNFALRFYISASG